jgi:hypothetical protein
MLYPTCTWFRKRLTFFGGGGFAIGAALINEIENIPERDYEFAQFQKLKV